MALHRSDLMEKIDKEPQRQHHAELFQNEIILDQNMKNERYLKRKVFEE